jgi:glutaredoxin-related protein
VDNDTWKKLKQLQLEWDLKTGADVIKELMKRDESKEKKK